MKKTLISITFCSGLLMACASIFAESPQPLSNKVATPVKSAQSGTWQLFWMPKEWIVKNLSSRNIDSLYLVVRPPDHGDLNEYWPCYAPNRLMVGIYPSNGKSKEMLHSCFDYCGPNDKLGNMLKGLWGPDTKLARVEVSLDGDQVVLKENYINRREGSEIVKEGKSKLQVYQRTWQRTLDPQQLMVLHDTSSCLELD